MEILPITPILFPSYISFVICYEFYHCEILANECGGL